MPTCDSHGHHAGICWTCADEAGRRLAIGERIVEDAFALADIVVRSAITLCGCGEGRTCDCGGDIARRILAAFPRPKEGP